jgi:hypothetical protein
MEGKNTWPKVEGIRWSPSRPFIRENPNHEDGALLTQSPSNNFVLCSFNLNFGEREDTTVKPYQLLGNYIFIFL